MKGGRPPRGVVDTSVVIAGASGLRGSANVANESAKLLLTWISSGHFVWLYTDDILREYKEVMRRLKVRRFFIGRFINLLREQGEAVQSSPTMRLSPDPGDDPFCACAERGLADFIVTLNPIDFPKGKLLCKVIAPGESIAVTRRGKSRRRAK